MLILTIFLSLITYYYLNFFDISYAEKFVIQLFRNRVYYSIKFRSAVI